MKMMNHKNDSLKIMVFYGSMRPNRRGIHAANYIVKKLQDRHHQVNLIDALQESLPILDLRYSDYEEGQAPDQLKRLHKLYQQADGFLVVAGEYNNSIQPGLKNLLDFFYPEFFHRPSAILCYSISSFGGIRAASDLRSVLGAMGMPAIPQVMPMPGIQKIFDEQGVLLDEKYEGRTSRLLNEFEWYANALRCARNKGLPNN